jgi:hypothetical protein
LFLEPSRFEPAQLDGNLAPYREEITAIAKVIFAEPGPTA